MCRTEQFPQERLKNFPLSPRTLAPSARSSLRPPAAPSSLLRPLASRAFPLPPSVRVHGSFVQPTVLPRRAPSPRRRVARLLLGRECSSRLRARRCRVVHLLLGASRAPSRAKPIPSTRAPRRRRIRDGIRPGPARRLPADGGGERRATGHARQHRHEHTRVDGISRVESSSRALFLPKRPVSRRRATRHRLVHATVPRV